MLFVIRSLHIYITKNARKFRSSSKFFYANVCIAAPGFDSKEQLAAHPEFVDLLAMNQTLMERWNKLVKPADKVYVTGDLGDSEWMKLLNGEIHIVD